MKKDFWKYQGTGNDFVIINNYNPTLTHSPELAKKLCDRHFGIGSDGLIILEGSEEADFKMVFYNPDGTQSFCGNGSRCAVMYAYEEGIITEKKTTFLSTDGLHSAEIDHDSVNLQMNPPLFLPLNFKEMELPVSHTIRLNTGSPHLLLLIESGFPLAEIDIKHHGTRIRYSDAFTEEGININFISIRDDRSISIRTYERGVEDETLSCGTGVTASAIGYHSLFSKTEGHNTIDVHALGGNLQVKFDFNAGDYSNIMLCGGAQPVFMGIINL